MSYPCRGLLLAGARRIGAAEAGLVGRCPIGPWRGAALEGPGYCEPDEGWRRR